MRCGDETADWSSSTSVPSCTEDETPPQRHRDVFTGVPIFDTPATEYNFVEDIHRDAILTSRLPAPYLRQTPLPQLH